MSLDIDDAVQWADEHTPAVLITIKRDGSMQSSDVAFAVVDGEFVVSLTADRAKTANVRRDPRVVLHVTAPDEWAYVSFSGEATLSEVAAAADDAVADRLVDYYRLVTGGEHPDWGEYRRAMVADGRLLLTLRPSRAVGQLPRS